MNQRLLYVCCLIITCIVIFSQCISKGPAVNEVAIRGEQFAGAATCVTCHKSIYDSYLATAHHNTSRPGSKTFVKGNFTAPDNIFSYNNETKVVMEDRAGDLFQSAYKNGVLQESHPFDITIGSGTKAQTYLYWDNDQYFQLPVSYFVAAHSWANSPAFPASHPNNNNSIGLLQKLGFIFEKEITDNGEKLLLFKKQ